MPADSRRLGTDGKRCGSNFVFLGGMTMFVRRWTASLLAVAGVIVWTSASQAADVFRLAMPSNTDTPTMTLGSAASDDAETIDVRGFRGGFCGGYRGGFCGGYRGGIGCGVFRGGGRILNGCGRAVFGCRPAIGYGYCAAPIYSYYSSGYSCYPYYSGGYSCYPSYSYYPIATDLSLPSATFSLRINPLVPRIVAQPLSGTQVPLNQAPLGDPVPYPTPGLMPPATAPTTMTAARVCRCRCQRSSLPRREASPRCHSMAARVAAAPNDAEVQLPRLRRAAAFSGRERGHPSRPQRGQPQGPTLRQGASE